MDSAAFQYGGLKSCRTVVEHRGTIPTQKETLLAARSSKVQSWACGFRDSQDRHGFRTIEEFPRVRSSVLRHDSAVVDVRHMSTVSKVVGRLGVGVGVADWWTQRFPTRIQCLAGLLEEVRSVGLLVAIQSSWGTSSAQEKFTIFLPRCYNIG